MRSYASPLPVRLQRPPQRLQEVLPHPCDLPLYASVAKTSKRTPVRINRICATSHPCASDGVSVVALPLGILPAYDAVRDALGHVPLLIMYLQPLFINKLFRAAFALQQSLVLVKVSPMPIEADFAADPKATPKALDRLFFLNNSTTGHQPMENADEGALGHHGKM